MSEPLYAKSTQLSSWKPRILSEDIPFFLCKVCNKIIMGIDSGAPIHYSGENRDPITVLPYMNWGSVNTCCDQEMERVVPKSLEEIPDDIKITYEITGGFNDNLIRLDWESTEEGSQPDWVALKTFTGLQVKYLLPGQAPHFAFAITETDSYAYCAEDPCLECIFHCKRGNVLYAHTPLYGVVAIPIHENNPR